MLARVEYFFLFILAVAAFLIIRHWFDRKREKLQDIDIVRDDLDVDNAQLGTWAQKNEQAFIQFRLKRDGSFIYKELDYPAKDTIKYRGTYRVSPATGYKGKVYNHLLAVSDDGNTIINHFISLTRTTKKDVDILSLQKDNTPDAPVMFFYRVEQ